MAKDLAVNSTKGLVSSEEDLQALALSMVVENGEEEILGQDEIEIPFLRIAQKGSAQVDEDKANFIEGLKPGYFFNTATSEVYGDELLLQVHGYYRCFLIWKGPKGQGKYNGSMTPEEFEAFKKTVSLVKDGGDEVQYVDGDELRYTDTRNFLVTLAERPDDGVMLYPMSSTGIKPARNWNTLNSHRRINGRPTKRYSTIWKLKTDGFEGKGFTWKQVSSITPLGWASPDLLEVGKQLEAFVGEVKANSDKVQHEDEFTGTTSAEPSDY